MGEAKYPIRATETTLSIIEELKATGGMGVTDLARRVGISKSAIHNHLATLEQHGYVVKEENEYRLSLKFLEIGGYIRSRMELFNVSESEVKGLANNTGELANLLTEERGLGVYIYRSKGEQAVQLDTYPGMPKYLHAMALGKAILAYMPEEKVRSIINEHGLPAITEDTVTDANQLFESLKEIRETGVAFDDEESASGVRCVAAPIEVDDQVLGSISVSAPTSRMMGQTFEKQIPEKVLRAANVIELNIKYP